MAKIDIDGIGIAYEIIGSGKRSAVITPGGRFSKDTPGVKPLAEKLAENGFRVLIWDRPNCGESDVAVRGTKRVIGKRKCTCGITAGSKVCPCVGDGRLGGFTCFLG